MPAIYAGQYGPEGIEYPDGRPARNVGVTVHRADGTLATLYSGKLKTATAPNPVFTDGRGNLVFFTDPGEVTITANGYTIPALVPVHPDDPALGVDAALSYVHEVPSPISLIQILHNLPWKPAGIVMIDQDGNIQEPGSVAYPQPGVMEIQLFKGLTFRGTVHLS